MKVLSLAVIAIAVSLSGPNVFAQAQVRSAGAENGKGGGSEAGNGGSVIVCLNPDQSIKSVELLDFYEGRSLRGFDLDLGPSEKSVSEKVNILLSRYNRLSPHMSDSLQGGAQEFESKTRFYTGIHLIEIPDSNHLYVPEGCHQEQIAVQRAPQFPEDRLYNVNKDLWDRLSNDGKAGLIVHEVIYGLALEASGGKIQDSQAVRYFVSKLSSTGGAAWMLEDYVSVARKLQFKFVEFGSNYFAINDRFPQFYFGGKFKGGPLFPDFGMLQIHFQDKNILVDSLNYDEDGRIAEFVPIKPTLLRAHDQNLWFAADRTIFVDANNHVGAGSILPENHVKFDRDGEYHLELDPVNKKPIGVIFDEQNGNALRYCGFCKGAVTLKGQTFKIKSDPDENKRFYFRWTELNKEFFLAEPTLFEVLGTKASFENGMSLYNDQVHRGTLSHPTEVKLPAGKMKLIGEVIIHQNGTLYLGKLAEDAELKMTDGSIVSFLKGMVLEFEGDGLVKGVDQ